MGALIISILFWLVGLLIILSGPIMNVVLTRIKKKMDAKSEDVKFHDNQASIQYTMAEDIIDIIPWFSVRLILTIIGMVVMALGFVSLGFWRI